ncbi:MAG: DUF370 domain-containing protein [Clostridia bacterium]|nr:DUF370 domain-containing protein [Clostridia bacterium]
MKLVSIGFGNMISSERIVAMVNPDSAPIKRIAQEAKERGTLIDATYGRRTKCVIIADSGHIILSAVQPFGDEDTVPLEIENDEENVRSAERDEQ